MSLLVHKYGGTSLASPQHIHQAAERIAESVCAGNAVVAVVSAMAEQTDKLLNVAYSVGKSPPSRELDALLATGEQTSAALLCMALKTHDIAARSYAAWQLPIHTDGKHMNARILDIEIKNIRACTDAGIVAVIAGFQGIDEHNNINTLGRGGSDTSAVAIAVKLKADECRIYTDVAGVYTADPRIVKQARVLSTISFEEMLELAGQGTKVLHARAVAMAGRYQVPLRVLANTDVSAQGTLLAYNSSRNKGSDLATIPLDSNFTNIKKSEQYSMETAIVSGISYNNNEAKIDLTGISNIPGVAARILGTVAQANIDVDMIVQSTGQDGATNLSFTVQRADMDKARALVEEVTADTSTCSVHTDNRIAKVSLVGIGMRGHAGVASKMFATLAKHKINIELISTSEIKVAVVIAEKHLKLALNTLHQIFCLEQEPI